MADEAKKSLSEARSESMFLTNEEIVTLTDYKRPADQKRWLLERGYRFDVGGSCRPKVLRIELKRHLTGGKSPRREPTLKVPQRSKKD